MMNGVGGGGGCNGNGNGIIMDDEHDNDTSHNPTDLTTTTTTKNATASSTLSISSPPTTSTMVNNHCDYNYYFCPRPKLFFLKKRPPFALSDGWNPDTEYRTNLFEPPSSVEGMGRGKKEVRGHLGSGSGNNGTVNGAILTTDRRIVHDNDNDIHH